MRKEMPATSPSDVNRRAKKGIRELLVREGALMGLTFAGGVVLARVLDPIDFGLFGITTFLVNVLALFGDCGLAPSLIQRKKALSDLDLRVGFTLQQVLVTSVVVLIWVAAPWLAGLYPEAPPELMWLIRVLAFSLYLTTWRSMSALQLERSLNYRRLALVEVVEKLSYQVIVVGLAVLGFGVWSLIAGVLAQGVLGTGLVYRLAPWRVRLAFDRAIAREILAYGIPYQTHRIVGNMKNWLAPTLVAALIGPEAVGFLMWGGGNGRWPLRLLRNVMRVSFPHFSRLQDHPAEVERLLSKYQGYFLVLTGFWLALLAAAGHDLTAWIYTEKWLPAVPVLVLVAAQLSLIALAWSTKSALSALGHVKFNTKVTLVNAVLSLGIGTGLVFAVGFIGVPLGQIAAHLLTLPWLYRGLRRGAMRAILAPALWVAVPVVLALGAGLGVRGLPLPLAARALATAAAVGLVYAATVWLLGPGWLKDGLVRRARAVQRRLRAAPAAEPEAPMRPTPAAPPVPADPPASPGSVSSGPVSTGEVPA